MSISDTFKIGQFGKYACTTEWMWNKKGAPGQDFDLWVVSDGGGRLTRNSSQVYELSAGDVFLLRGWEDYYGVTNRLRTLQVSFIHFDYCDSHGNVFFPDESEIPDLYRKMIDFPFFLKLLERIWESARRRQVEEAEKWLSTALAELDFQKTLIENSALVSNPVGRRIATLAEKIASSPEQPYHLPELAEEMSYSPDHFSKLFKAKIGVPFRDHVIESRIEKAKLLLRSSSLKILEIADSLGYSDIYLFSKQFKKKTGTTPTAYRKAVL